ncbi:hypothetical protein PENSPDRAFT_687030 [Peniophora sp. CONT]|nr:hypothetical protein PENSPDRAFT_687030 [Peniophora sp. CONT]
MLLRFSSTTAACTLPPTISPRPSSVESMGRPKALTYGDIAETVLPSVIFTIDTLNVLAQAVDSYVQLAPRDRRLFFQEQMANIWPQPIDWGSPPKTEDFKAQWSALRRYFKEQGRIRGPPALPEQLSTRKWTGLRVCGVVYRDSIDEMVFLGTGMKPGDPRGYLGQRIKCRTVFYWKLSPSDRRQLVEMAEEWQSGSAPVEQKIEAYYRRFQAWIRNVHMVGLREFGQHLVTMSIPEPGLTNPPRLFEFMHELKILDKPLVKVVPVGDTLANIYLEVNHAAGRIEGAALPAVLNRKSRLKRKTTWSMSEASFVGHDEIVLKEEEFDEELFYKEAISMVYLIVRMAHSNISRYRDLDPPWSTFEDLVDKEYLLPDLPMCIPTSLRQPNCFKYLKHWFTVTKGLKFTRWQRKNSLPMPPVPLEERWWSDSLPDYVPPEEAVPAPAIAAMNYVPVLLPPVHLDPGVLTSPYGSAGGHLVHDEAVREQEAIDMLEVPAVPDPEDARPHGEEEEERSDEDSVPPYLVPANSEARAQWCAERLQRYGLPSRSTRRLRGGIRQLAELPMIPNASYPLTAAAKSTGLPVDLSWTRRTASPPQTEEELNVWLVFLRGSPWCFSRNGRDVFAGTELVWAFVLGWVLYLQGYTAAGGSSQGDTGVGIYSVGCAGFSKVFGAFEAALSAYGETFEYPGWPPSAKYALVSSRSHYLAYLVRNEEQDVLLPLLRLVTRMDDAPLEPPFEVIPHSSSTAAPSWITNPQGVPSWQWQRCGLPPASHGLPQLPDLILTWLRRPDLLVNPGEGKARSRETGLAIFLKVALLFSDLENIDDGNWTYAGAAGLEHSCLRSYTRRLKMAISDWANEEALRLEPLLPPLAGDEGDLQDGGEEDQASPLPDEFRRSPSAGPVKRQSVSHAMPAHMDETFMEMDLDDLDLPHSVQEYRAEIDAQPRTAVQELTRKGLQGIAELEGRKKLNKALRAGATQNLAPVSGLKRKPAPQRTEGGWLPMPSQDALSLQSDDEDRPPRKKRRTMVIKRPREENQTKPRGPVRRGPKIPGRGRGKPRRRKTVQKRLTVTGDDEDEDEQADEDEHASDAEESSGDSEPVRSVGGNCDDASSTYGGDEDEMPSTISAPRRSRFDEFITPVVFEAEGCSSSMDVDSDEMGSALSVRPPQHRRLAFVEPERPVLLSLAGRSALPRGRDAPLVRPRPKMTERSKALRAARGLPPVIEQSETNVSGAPLSDSLRRSRRLQAS